MLRSNARLFLIAGIALLALLAVGRAAVDLYTDALWFDSLGFRSLFLTRLAVTAIVRIATGIVGAAFVLFNLWLVTRHLGPVHLRRRYGNLEIAEQVPRGYLLAGTIVTALLAGWWLSSLRFDSPTSLAAFAWLRQSPWGVRDPLFGRDAAFYVFSLPVYDALNDYALIIIVWTMMLVLLGYVLVGAVRMREQKLEVDERARFHFTILVAVLTAVLAFGYWLGRYFLLLEGGGFGGALGYTDVTARLPARSVMCVLALLASASLVYGAIKKLWAPPALGLAVLLLGSIFVGQAYPALIQKLRVEPNMLEREAPYIAWNLDFTRRAFGLDAIRRSQVPYKQHVRVPSWETLAPGIAGLPLWDGEPLRTVYNQLQAIFGYYHFAHVDYDRYAVGGGEAQVGIGVREFSAQGLPEASRNWVTLRLNPQYTRGLGAVVSPTFEATADGEPINWVSNVNPVRLDPAAPRELELRDPRAFFGELTTDYVIVQPSKDSLTSVARPAGSPNGVLLSSFARLLAFAWRFSDKNLLFAGDLSHDSRLLFRRGIAERLSAVAPFLIWDSDPYPVISDGHIIWMIDGYSVSGTFPLSRPIQVEGMGGVRYLRNSAKATLDAVTGTVRLYAVTSTDPILETYRRVFPGLFAPLAQMPADLQRHLRYPPVYFNAQADVLEEYHLLAPEAFYAGQDVWQIPQELGTPGVPRPYRPNFATMRFPGSAQPEFLLTMPFIARQRQNMTALLIGRSDPPHYGELDLLELPRDQQIPGPTQVQAVIEQDPAISPQLTLWRQAGSDVDLGHLRIVPLDSGFLFIQPLFLSAQAQGSPIPELQRVIASDGRAVVMAHNLPDAVRGLASPEQATTAASQQPGAATAAAGGAPGALDWRRAYDLLQDADKRLRSGDFSGFGTKWSELRQLLERLSKNQR